MTRAFTFGKYLVLLYIGILIYLAVTLRETAIIHLYSFLFYGIPALISYFILVVLYFNSYRKTAGVFLILLVLGYWWWFNVHLGY